MIGAGSLVARYASFAALATLVNLLGQRVVLLAGTSAVHLLAAMVVGTGAGLVVKYVLDKRWIFDDRSTSLRDHGRMFGLYTLMGLATTVIFWGMETAFWSVWHTTLARETGAVLGLAIGYVTKYFLDRRFVFNQMRPQLQVED